MTEIPDNKDNMMPYERTCLVCADVTMGIHFGIDSCRACAAFFRRSIVEKKLYSCRTGGNCTIRKNIRNLCRKCRLQKCLDVGMKQDNVQGKRDSIVPKLIDPNPLCVVPLSDIEAVPSSSKSPLPVSPPKPDLLLKALDNYRQLCSIRRATEIALDPTVYQRMVPMGPLSGYALGTAAKLSLFFRSQIPSVTEFVSNTFPEYEQLDNDERWILLRPFLVYFLWTDGCFKTSKKIARDHFTQFYIFTETMYFDLAHCDEWNNDINDPDTFKTSISNLIRKFMQPEFLRSIYSMETLKLSDEEYVAILGLLFWNSCVEGQTENMKNLIGKVRSRIFEQIYAYHRTVSETFNAARFGELLDLCSVLMVEILKCREYLELYTVLDAFKKNDFFYEMVKSLR